VERRSAGPRSSDDACFDRSRLGRYRDGRSGSAVIPAGYMAKRVAARPEWLTAAGVIDVYSVSHCISKDHADYIKDWRHNGYWLFDSPDIIRQLARAHSVDLEDAVLFFYEVHELEFDEGDARWQPFAPEPSFPTRVVEPSVKTLEGFDVVSFYLGSSPECSPLSCSGLATEIETNEHCLLPSFEHARQLLSDGRFDGTEPGPFRYSRCRRSAWS
jgi:hypothetical protein